MASRQIKSQMHDTLTYFEKYLPPAREFDEIAIFYDEMNPPRKRSGKTTAEIAIELEKKYQRKLKRGPQARRINRYDIFKKAGFKCMACGTSARDAKLHIDHIKPISIYPELVSDPDNYQVLCRSCNISKGNRHEDDLRFDEPKHKNQ